MKLTDELFETLCRDVDFQLDILRLRFEQTLNPYYAWSAISVCSKEKKTLPDWVASYLGECSERMMLARAVQDLRDALPKIFGFPPKKRGPGRLLDPDPVDDDEWKKMRFALRFAGHLARGETAVDARATACNDVFEEDAEIDDKTLQRWLLQEFDLEQAPSTDEEWKEVCKETYLGLVNLMLSHREKFRETLP